MCECHGHALFAFAPIVHERRTADARTTTARDATAAYLLVLAHFTYLPTLCLTHIAVPGCERSLLLVLHGELPRHSKGRAAAKDTEHARVPGWRFHVWNRLCMLNMTRHREMIISEGPDDSGLFACASATVPEQLEEQLWPRAAMRVLTSGSGTEIRGHMRGTMGSAAKCLTIFTESGVTRARYSTYCTAELSSSA